LDQLNISRISGIRYPALPDIRPDIWLGNLVSGRILDIKKARLSDRISGASLISTSVFFHQTTPPRPQILGLKPFCIWLRIYEKIRQRNRRFSEQWGHKRSLGNPIFFLGKLYVFFRKIFSLKQSLANMRSKGTAMSYWYSGVAISKSNIFANS
jgi:hypothetical protein